MSPHLRPVPDDGPPSSGTADLAGCLKRASQGDEAAFAQIYDAMSARIYGLILRVLRDPSQAEEVTQECFFEIWRTAARYVPDKGTPSGWMLTIAHRRAVDRVRAAEASTRRDHQYQHSTHMTDHDSTAETAQASLDAERVRLALTTLTEAQRQAVELAYFGGYTHTEIAAMADLPLGTVKTRIRDGMIRLRDTMGIEG